MSKITLQSLSERLSEVITARTPMIHEWLHRHSPQQQHSLPANSPQAGAQWSPDIQPYDRNRPAFPFNYSAEEQQKQAEAGERLHEQLSKAMGEGAKDFTIQPGVYRIKDRIQILDTEGLTLFARDVELITADADGGHFQVMRNKNLTVLGPLVLDTDPLSFTQGEIVDVNQAEHTLDIKIHEGYEIPSGTGKRTMLFTAEGVMLPHNQDGIEGCTELGDRVVRLKMNENTFNQHAGHIEEVLKPGHLMVVETQGRGGIELRCNFNTAWEDVSCFGPLVWSGDDTGETKLVRWKGTRRRDTNRLFGGGFPQLGFKGGAFLLLDSVICYNHDDITNIKNPQTFAFHQTGPQQFHIMEDFAKEGDILKLIDYTTLEACSECKIVAVEEKVDQAVKEEFTQLISKHGARDTGGAPRLCTVDCDVMLPELAIASIVTSTCRLMQFERNYICGSLNTGINAKGADQVIIRDNIVERTTGAGISVGMDPYWWEGNPSRNIEIVGNTVLHSSYAPKCEMPAIAVFVGGSCGGRPSSEATGQLQAGIRISNNAIATAGAGDGICVTNAKMIEITDNIIADTQGGRNHCSIYLNAVSEGTRVAGNLFAGQDASTSAVQIKTGPLTPSHFVVHEDNRTANPEVLIPPEPWQFFPATDPGATYEGEGWELKFEYPWQHYLTRERGAAVVFSFKGAKIRVLGDRAPWTGLADVFIDNQFAGIADASWPIEEIQPYYVSPELPTGEHQIKIVNRNEPGEQAEGGNCLSIHSFDVLPCGSGHCQWDPRAGPIS